MPDEFPELYELILMGMSYGELQRFYKEKTIKLNGFSKIRNKTTQNMVILKLKSPKYIRPAYNLLQNELKLKVIFDEKEPLFSSNIQSDLNVVIENNPNKNIEECIGKYLITLVLSLGLAKTLEVYKKNANIFQKLKAQAVEVNFQDNKNPQIELESSREKELNNKDKIIEKQKKEITKLKQEKTDYIDRIKYYENKIRLNKQKKENNFEIQEQEYKQHQEALEENRRKIEDLEDKLYSSETKRIELEKILKRQKDLYTEKTFELEKKITEQLNKIKEIEQTNLELESTYKVTSKSHKVEKEVKTILVLGKGKIPKIVPESIFFLDESEVKSIHNKIAEENHKELWILDYGVINTLKREVMQELNSQVDIHIIKNYSQLNTKIKEFL